MEHATLHATAVAIAGRAVLIKGSSGSGKSSLALQMLALGAKLVADDYVVVHRSGDTVIASCPPALRGMIEARGFGLLRAVPSGPTALVCVMDLDQPELERLPPWRRVTLLGCDLPLLHHPQGVMCAPALLQYIRAGRTA